MRILPWVQQHTILRRDTGNIIDGRWTGLVSDNEAIEELCDVILGLDERSVVAREEAIEQLQHALIIDDKNLQRDALDKIRANS